jgi:hypothetical protein
MSLGQKAATQRQEVYNGRVFSAAFSIVLAAGAVVDAALVSTGGVLYLDSIGLNSNAAETLLELYEDSETSGGTPIILYNRNRNDPDVTIPGFTALSSPTVTEIGTRASDPQTLYGDTESGTNNEVFSAASSRSSILLKAGVTSILRITNTGASTGTYSISLGFAY